MKIVTAFTEEVDSADEAAAELIAQIKPEKNLRAHSLGIVHCHPDFFDRDVLRKIAEAFNFPLIGCASNRILGREDINGLGLSLTVLSSDEACFTTARSGKITEENCDGEMEKLYSALIQGQGEAPALLLFYAPFQMGVPLEHILVSLGKTAENIPAFGSLGLSFQDGYLSGDPLYGGEALADSVVLAAVFTKTKPRFYSASVKPDRVIRLNDPVTAAKGKILLSIGGKTYKEYLETTGIGTGEFLPYSFFGPDGSEIIRVCLEVTPEGYGVFTGEVPANAAAAVCTVISKEDIADTAEELLSRVSREGKDMSGCLIYSCMTRQIMFGTDKNVELRVVQKNIGDKAFNFAYCGGEVFPQTLESGRIKNQLQNNTLIVCAFHG